MIKPLKKEIAEAERNIKNFDFKDSHDESLKKAFRNTEEYQ